MIKETENLIKLKFLEFFNPFKSILNNNRQNHFNIKQSWSWQQQNNKKTTHKKIFLLRQRTLAYEDELLNKASLFIWMKQKI